MPLAINGAIHVLVETLGTDPARDAELFESAIGEAIEQGEAPDAALAQSERERAAIWRVRDQSSEFARHFSPHVDYDVSLPVARIGEFVPVVAERLRADRAPLDILFFGHVADGNLHLSVQTPPGVLSKADADAIVYGAVAERQGSISAEHGIGLLKKAYLAHSRSEPELALMRTIKAALDPRGILNPGKVF
jgi:FAD/FMN-containing dehydrogenase